MNLILLGAGIVLFLMGLFSGRSVNISSILASFKKDKDSEIKNSVNDAKIETQTSSEKQLESELKTIPKTESDKTKDEILKFWNKK